MILARTKLTDKQKKKIIADYVECQNKSRVAKNYGVSWDTVNKIIKANGDTEKKLEHKKEQNTQDILAYLDSQTESLKRFGDYLLDDRLDPVKNKEALDGMSLRDLMQAYGVFMDKALKSKEILSKRDIDVTISDGRKSAAGLSTEELKRLAKQFDGDER